MQICAEAGMGWQEAEKYPEADTDPPLNLLPKLTSQSGALCPEVSFIPKDRTLPTPQESLVQLNPPPPRCLSLCLSVSHTHTHTNPPSL